LESGRSETGVWAASSASEAQLFPNLIAGTISFPIRLAAARPATDAVFIDAAQTALNPEARPEKIKEACGAHGTLADPTAERGYLCVYTGVEAFNDVDTAGALVSNKDAKFLTIAGALGDPGASTIGASVDFEVPEVRSEEEEEDGYFPNIRVQGTWAVTAP
jgi:hypothetical protein